MRYTNLGLGVAAAICIALTASVWSQSPAVQRSVVINSDGSVTIQNAVIPLSGLLSEGGRKVLMRTRPTEGPGAPVPVPGGIADMAEVRRVYNENLKPNVDHMREVFPVDIEETTINGISAAIVTPKGGVPEKNKNRLFLNGPGGGFRTGVRGNGLLISIPVAATLGVKVVTITYRQGPEYRFPAASEDLLKVWDHFTKTYKPQNMGLVGCSAGGSLVTHTTAMLIKQGRPTPGVLGVYCAGLGSGPGSGDSGFLSTLSVTNAPAGALQTGGPGPAPRPPAGPSYMDGADQADFAVSPTRDETLLAKWPPTIFFTASRDGAASGALYSYRALIRLGIDAQVMVFDGLYHGFMTNPDFPESREGYKTAAAFFDKHLGRGALVSLQAQTEKTPGTVVLKGSSLGGVKFDHARHATLADTKCEACHHPSKPEKAQASPHQKCQDCHTRVAAAPMKTRAQLAFHDGPAKKGLCVDCHQKAEGKAPLKCNECHKKENV